MILIFVYILCAVWYSLIEKMGKGLLAMEYSIQPAAFGAVADGQTDCSEAFQRALDTLVSGGILYIPGGEYRLKKSIAVRYSHISIVGDGWRTHLVYDYVQKEGDRAEQASAFVFSEGIRDVTVRDIKLEYEGYFYPHFGESYAGRINGLYFLQCFDVRIHHCDISGFNSSGIQVATGDEKKYAERFKVEDCYLHHNRVAGVAYGYVDGISILNCDLEYQGSVLDGGTGYGCAGSSGEKPRHVQIKNNRARFNYRKGIDLHAGIQAVIEGNICVGNRLYGIYAEGPKTGDILIRGNIVSGMKREDVGLPLPYEWIEGISFGVWSEQCVEQEYFNYIISENEITEFGLDRQHARPIHCYSCFQKGSVQIKNNIIKCGRVDSVVQFAQPFYSGGQAISIDISGNQIFAERTEQEIFALAGFDTAALMNNRVRVEHSSADAAVSLPSGRGAAAVAWNWIDAPGCEYLAESFCRNIISQQNRLNEKFQ